MRLNLASPGPHLLAAAMIVDRLVVATEVALVVALVDLLVGVASRSSSTM